MPHPSSPPMSTEAPSLPSRRQYSSSFPRPTLSHTHRCSRLTPQHGGEQSKGDLDLESDVPSHVTLATCVPILVFLGLYVLDLGPMYAKDRQTDVRQKHCLMLPPIRGGA